MLKLIQQEVYKLVQKRSTTIGLGLLAAVMAFCSNHKIYPNLLDAQGQFEGLYSAGFFSCSC